MTKKKKSDKIARENSMTELSVAEVEQPKRQLTVTLQAVSGGIHLMEAKVNDIFVISVANGMQGRWDGTILGISVKLEVRVFGIGNATFRLGIDLPGTADDQSLTLKLSGGFYETTLYL